MLTTIVMAASIACQSPMMPHDQALKEIQEEYQEIPVMISLSPDGKFLYEFLINPEKNTSTVLVTNVNGCSSVVFKGINSFFNFSLFAPPSMEVKD